MKVAIVRLRNKEGQNFTRHFLLNHEPNHGEACWLVLKHFGVVVVGARNTLGVSVREITLSDNLEFLFGDMNDTDLIPFSLP